MEHGVHVLAPVDAVEHGAGDVADAFGHDPEEVGGGQDGGQGLEGHEHTEAHSHEAGRFEVAVFLEIDEAHHRSYGGAEPYEDEQAPAPEALVAQRDERDGRIAAGDVPVDGGVVPPSQPLLPLAPVRKGVVEGGGHVGHEHAEEIKNHACGGPAVAVGEAHVKEDGSGHDADEDSAGVTPGVPQFFAMTEMYPLFHAAKVTAKKRKRKEMGFFILRRAFRPRAGGCPGAPPPR